MQNSVETSSIRKPTSKSEISREFKKRLYSFTLRLIRLLDKLPQDNVSRRIGDQLLRSGTSIIGNYVEGQSASSNKDFRNYLNHSLKSCNESKLWLGLLRDSGRVAGTETEWYLHELDEFSRIFAASILTLKSRAS
jgi:four helix bundle protein